MGSRTSLAGVAAVAALTCALGPLGPRAAHAQPASGKPSRPTRDEPPRPAGDEPVDPYAAPPAPVPAPAPAPEPENKPSQDPGPSAPPADDDIDDQVAQALYRRGMDLYRRGNAADAKALFAESLQRSPRGKVSADALRMLRAANRRLGIADQDDGRAPRAQEGVLDPYGAASPAPGEGPLDPYGAPSPRARPAPEPEVPLDQSEPRAGSELGRRSVIAWSGAVGLIAGLAVAGPEDDSGEFSDGAVLAGVVGAAGGLGLSYWLTQRAPLTAGQSASIDSFATWGAASAGLLGDATTGTDSVANDVWKYVAAGGLVGLGGGVLYARAARPTVEDVALTDSLSFFGAAAGLTIAAGIDPPESEAFSLNALFGGAAGLAAGLLLSPRVEVSLRRTVFLDVGAAAGAALVWGVVYPLMADDTTHNDEQVAGWLSTATLAGGAAVAWYFTRGMDTGRSRSLASSRRRGPPAPPALVRRGADGEWQLGAPFVRPLRAPSLAPPGGGSAIAVDLVSGRF